MKKVLISVTAITLFAMSSHAVMAEDVVSKKPKRVGWFDRMDSNNDGVVSKSESNTFNDERFKEMDLDADGNISRDEMNAHRTKYRTRKVLKEEDLAE
jgi:Ca2+-binding EF-hand superfamily protein